MLVFKTYFQILNRYKSMVILYTVILLSFAVFNMKTSDNPTSFVASRPGVCVDNQDAGNAFSDFLYDYMGQIGKVRAFEAFSGEEEVSDALFYRQINYFIEIPKGFGDAFLSGERPDISVRSTGDYQASCVEMQLERFLKTASLYQKEGMEKEQLMEKVKETLEETAEVKLTSSLDTESLSKAALFYNFANYSLLAGCVYAIAIVLSSFRERRIRMRTDVSPVRYAGHNLQLLLANGVFALGLWALYVIISMVLARDVMFTKHGLLFIANSFVFALCALSIGFFIGSLTTDKGALGGIINVVALGSSFLCGAFVPVQWLPDGVLKAAHILPSYWFIQNNERIAKLETFDFASVKPLLINGAVVIGFTLLFVAMTNLLSRKRQRMEG